MIRPDAPTPTLREIDGNLLSVNGLGRQSGLRRVLSTAPSVARETANPYSFVRNEGILYIDFLGLKPCSSCDAGAIQREGLARGLEYIYRTIEERREYGGKICCEECTGRAYSANVVYGNVIADVDDPDSYMTVNLANSKCRSGDKVVADWHTHPDSSTQTGKPGQTSFDRNSVIATARILDCDFVGFMINNHIETTVMSSQGVETTVENNPPTGRP